MADQRQSNYRGDKQDYEESKLDPKYLNKGYFNEDGSIRKEYMDKYAKEIGNNLTSDIKYSKRLGYNKVREYYEAVIMVKTKTCNKFISIGDAKVELETLVGRIYKRWIANNSTEYFKEFISKNVSYVTDTDDNKEFINRLKAFERHFEMVVCYIKVAK